MDFISGDAMDFVSGDMDFISGLDCLGAEDSAADKTLTVIKKAGPGLVSAISEAFDKKSPMPETPKYHAEEKSWLTSPAMGPIPGWGVLLGGAGLLTGLGFAIKAMVRR